MSTQDRKSREDARLKRKILNAALRVLAEQGYGKVSMRKIAALIDYSPPTIYRFFRNKEDLLRTIAAETYGDMAARFEAVGTEGDRDPLDTLKALIMEYVVFCVERPDMFRLFSELASFEVEDGIIFESLGGRRHQVYQSWFRCLREAIAAGRLEVRDEMRLFLYLWDAVHGYIEHRIADYRIPRGPLAQDSAEYLALIFRGIHATTTP